MAMVLAERFNGELICADSWTVYRGFDIGTAKPSVEDRRQVPHHLLDCADPAVGFSAVEFQKQATAAIEDIQGRGKLPIMVGGAGLYVDSVLFDYQFLPPPAAGIREQLSRLSLEALLQLAHSNGLDTIGIDLRNKRRIMRLIENNGLRPTKAAMRDNSLVLGMSVESDQLRHRVVSRVDEMLAAGLEQEVFALAARYGWEAEPMKGIGYREWQPYFESRPGIQSQGQSMLQTRERIIAATMGLAKRQRTWFNRNKSIQWLDGGDSIAQAVDKITAFIDT